LNNGILLVVVQMFLDDVGVVVSMVSITLLALIVVILKVIIFDPSVSLRRFRMPPIVYCRHNFFSDDKKNIYGKIREKT
jgi:hypothetical protein